MARNPIYDILGDPSKPQSAQPQAPAAIAQPTEAPRLSIEEILRTAPLVQEARPIPGPRQAVRPSYGTRPLITNPYAPPSAEEVVYPLAAGLTEGATLGLGKYVGAGLASGMSHLFPQGGQPMSYQEALAGIHAAQQPLQGTAAYEIPRTLGQIGLAAATGGTSIPAQMATQGVISGLSTYTGTPEATLGQAAEAGALGSALTGVVGGGAKAASEGVKYLGQKVVKSNVEKVISQTESKDPDLAAGAVNQLQRMFGDRFEIAKRNLGNPRWQKILGVGSKEEAEQAVQNMSIKDFAEKMAQKPENLTFARETAKGLGQQYGVGAAAEKEAAKHLAATTLGQELRNAAMNSTLGGLAGYYGATQLGVDPALGVLLGAGLGSPAAYKLAGARSAAGSYFLSPSAQNLATMGALGIGRLGGPTATQIYGLAGRERK